jgi:hypothetical protein
VKAKTFENCAIENIIENQIINNSKCFKIVQCKTLSYNQSIFPRTIVDWNKLGDSVAQANTVDGFKSAVFHLD